MNSLIKYFFLTSLVIISCHSPKNETNQPNKINQELVYNLNEYFEALTSLKKFNGGVLIQKDGNIVIHKVYNMEEDVNNSLYVSENSQFDIHSISKLMAKACVVKLENRGLIKREEKLNKYISDFPKGEIISIQNLLDNNSGLPRELSNKQENLIEKTPAEYVELIKEEELLSTPGTKALYSNLGYQLIYFIISEIVNKPFVEYVNQEFFIPLEMNYSGAHFHMNNQNLVNPVKNHINEEGEIVSVPNFQESDKNQSRIYSTLDDLLKFINYIKDEPYRSALINKKGNIGWSGGGDGILSHVEAILNSGYELIFFSNYDEIPFGEIINDVEKIITNKPYEIPKEINRQSIDLDKNLMKKFAGKYDMAEFNHDEFEIRIENDNFAFYQNGESGGVLQAENDSTLFGDPKDEDYFILRETKTGSYNLIFKYKGVEIVGKKKQ